MNGGARLTLGSNGGRGGPRAMRHCGNGSETRVAQQSWYHIENRDHAK